VKTAEIKNFILWMSKSISEQPEDRNLEMLFFVRQMASFVGFSLHFLFFFVVIYSQNDESPFGGNLLFFFFPVQWFSSGRGKMGTMNFNQKTEKYIKELKTQIELQDKLIESQDEIITNLKTEIEYYKKYIQDIEKRFDRMLQLGKELMEKGSKK